MARMSREFSLVLLGAGALTAGYFLYPEPDAKAAQDEKLEQEVAANGGTTHRRSAMGTGFIWIHSGFGSSSRSLSAASSTARGGFGSMGRGIAGMG